MNDFFQLTNCLLRNSWELLTSVIYPGTNMSIALIIFGAFIAVVSLRVIGYLFGFTFNRQFMSDTIKANSGKMVVYKDR